MSRPSAYLSHFSLLKRGFIVKREADGQIRTDDLLFTKELLYP